MKNLLDIIEQGNGITRAEYYAMLKRNSGLTLKITAPMISIVRGHSFVDDLTIELMEIIKEKEATEVVEEAEDLHARFESANRLINIIENVTANMTQHTNHLKSANISDFKLVEYTGEGLVSYENEPFIEVLKMTDIIVSRSLRKDDTKRYLKNLSTIEQFNYINYLCSTESELFQANQVYPQATFLNVLHLYHSGRMVQHLENILSHIKMDIAAIHPKLHLPMIEDNIGDDLLVIARLLQSVTEL